MMNRTGNSKLLKKLNEARILDFVRLHGSISRIGLSELTGLSPTSTGKTVSRLIDEGYLRETGTGESTGGRKPVRIELSPDSFYTVGIDLDTDAIKLAAIDITGRVIYQNTAALGNTKDAERIIMKTEKLIRKAADIPAIVGRKLLGIGISVPGLVDGITREVVLAPNLDWKNVFIHVPLSKALQVPVHVENEAMASAICEAWVGCCKSVEYFVCINIKSGIGAGIFATGAPYHGCGGSAGEIGHIVVDEHGPLCGCGNHGCLETLASTARIIDNAKKIIMDRNAKRLDFAAACAAEFTEAGFTGRIDLGDIVRMAENGDEDMKNILLKASEYLGIAISYLVNLLNPSKIVIGREFVRYADIVMEHLQCVVRSKALSVPASRVEIAASQVGEDSSVLGAAIIPLKTLFGK